MLALLIAPMFAAAGYSLIYLLCGGGLGGAVLIFIVAKMVGKCVWSENQTALPGNDWWPSAKTGPAQGAGPSPAGLAGVPRGVAASGETPPQPAVETTALRDSGKPWQSRMRT